MKAIKMPHESIHYFELLCESPQLAMRAVAE